MKLKKQISKKRLIQLACFAVVVCGALLFDALYQGNEFSLKEIQDVSDIPDADHGAIYFYNPPQPVNLKTSVQQLAQSMQYLRTTNKFLQKYHDTRDLQLLKAEKLKAPHPQEVLVHLLVFKRCHYSSPDDIPLVS